MRPLTCYCYVKKIGRESVCVTESKKPTHTAMAVMVNVNCLLWVGDVDVRTSVLTEKFYKFIRVYLSQTEDMPRSKSSRE